MASASNFVASDGKQKLNLPFGYKFYPSDDEVVQYLKLKIFGEKLPLDIIPTIPNLYRLSPEEFPLDEFKYDSERQSDPWVEPGSDPWVERQWFFFSNRVVEGNRIIFPTKDGYWHSSESPTEVEDMEDTVVGFKTTLEFYRGIWPHGIKSNHWTVYEYRLNPDVLDAAKTNDSIKDKVETMVVCRIIRREYRCGGDDVHAA